jgi:GTP pyrophosphokinase
MSEPSSKRPPLLTDRFDEAFLLASEHHRSQLRKGTSIPYISHLMAVASLVLEMGGTEDEAIGALLHDMVEDGGGPAALADIRARFGDDVARIVDANSDTDVEPKPPWRERKEAYIAAIAHKQPDELRVSLADKLHNARAILLDYRVHGEDLWARFKAGEGASVRWYYRALREAFAARRDDLGAGAVAYLDELGRVVAEIDRLAPPPWSADAEKSLVQAVSAWTASLEASDDLPEWRERHMQASLVAFLAERGFARLSSTPGLDDWRPGLVDVVVDTADHGPSWLELKWCRSRDGFGFCIWDAAKIAAAVRQHRAARGYLVVGAPTAAWHNPPREARVLESAVHKGDTIVRDYAVWWRAWHRENANTFPTRVPTPIVTEPVADVEIPRHGWTIRVVRVTSPGTALFDAVVSLT